LNGRSKQKQVVAIWWRFGNVTGMPQQRTI
jgi:hypothetical protein